MSRFTRRTVLKNAAGGALVLGAGGVLAGRGSANLGGTSSSRAAAGKPRHGGTLRVGLTGGTSADNADPNVASGQISFLTVSCLYDNIVWQNTSGQPVLRAAEEITPNKDATVWTIRLRKGMLFHDGREATAADLIYSIARIYNPKNPGQGLPSILGINMREVKALDRYTVRVPFSRAYATFIDNQATQSMITLLPRGFDPKKPIGTGPFKLVSLSPGQQVVMARNEHYWNDPLPYVDKLILTNYSDEISKVNALLGGQVDAVGLLSQDVLGAVTGSGKKVVISDGGGWNPLVMRTDTAPFTDVRVRQAFRLMVDRPKMMKLLFGGHGTLGNDVFIARWSRQYDRSLPQRAQDIEQAKSLLKAAGRDGMTVELVVSNIGQGTVNMAQLFAQDASAAGVKVKLRTVTPTEFFGPEFLQRSFTTDFWYNYSYFTSAANSIAPGAPFNETHWNDPKWTKLYKQALATVDVAKRTEIGRELQKIDWKRGGYIVPMFPPVIDGYAPNVHGAVQSRTGQTFNMGDFEHLWLS